VSFDDDAQWADEPSLRFLVYLLGRLDRGARGRTHG
jgi:predicted ATPase